MSYLGLPQAGCKPGLKTGAVIGDVFLNKNGPDTGIKKSLPVVWKGFFFI